MANARASGIPAFFLRRRSLAQQSGMYTSKSTQACPKAVTSAVPRFGQAWVDFDVYMPDCWARDPQRRKKAGIPEGLAFATKPELALEQVKRLIAGGLRVLWAAADEVYGRSGDFRAGLRGARPVLRRHRSLRHHDHLREEQGHTR